MLSAGSYVYADKFTACVQNVRLRTHACIGTSLAYMQARRSARPSWSPLEFQNSAAQSCFL